METNKKYIILIIVLVTILSSLTVYCFNQFDVYGFCKDSITAFYYNYISSPTSADTLHDIEKEKSTKEIQNTIEDNKTNEQTSDNADALQEDLNENNDEPSIIEQPTLVLPNFTSNDTGVDNLYLTKKGELLNIVHYNNKRLYLIKDYYDYINSTVTDNSIITIIYDNGFEFKKLPLTNSTDYDLILCQTTYDSLYLVLSNDKNGVIISTDLTTENLLTEIPPLTSAILNTVDDYIEICVTTSNSINIYNYSKDNVFINATTIPLENCGKLGKFYANDDKYLYLICDYEEKSQLIKTDKNTVINKVELDKIININIKYSNNNLLFNIITERDNTYDLTEIDGDFSVIKNSSINLIVAFSTYSHLITKIQNQYNLYENGKNIATFSAENKIKIIYANNNNVIYLNSINELYNVDLKKKKSIFENITVDATEIIIQNNNMYYYSISENNDYLSLYVNLYSF